MEKKELVHCWWDCKLVQPLWKAVWRFLRKLKIELPFDPAIPLLGIYPEKTMTRKDTCTPVFIEALCAIAKTWKQPKCPSTEEWIKKKWYIYTMEYYSAIKRNEIPAFSATWMDLEIIMQSEVSHAMRHQHQMLSLTCGIWKKGQTELLCRTDADSQTLKNLWSLEETVCGVGGCAWVVGWKSCEIRLLWSLYNYSCDKFIWVIKKICIHFNLPKQFRVLLISL